MTELLVLPLCVLALLSVFPVTAIHSVLFGD